jgi:phosphonate transport system permease protein
MGAAPSSRRSRRVGLLVIVLSFLVPGLGQIYSGRRYRGVAVLISTTLAVLTAVWYGVRAWYLVPALLWIWNVWDAFSLTRGHNQSAAVPVLVLLAMGYGIGWQVTQIDPVVLTRNLSRAGLILGPMLQPDIATHRELTNSAWVGIQVPCGSNAPPGVNEVNNIQIQIAPSCGNLREMLVIKASGLWPNSSTEIEWATPIGDRLPLGPQFTSPLLQTSDSQGNLTALVQIPPDALTAVPNPSLPLEHRIYLSQSRPLPGYQLTQDSLYVLQGVVETIFLALVATTVGMLAAVPISFLAARNLMGGHLATLAIYTLTRTGLNILRSVEPLIIAIIFVVIVGLGPFAGAIAIGLHTIAALAKLYSEVIEGIDPGPLEAIRAAGGSWPQVVRYAVIPQIVPAFTSFTMYRWDINVRTSTIIGFVGGGGIGFYLYQWIIKGDFRPVGTSFVAIAVIVLVLDAASAQVRARLV